MTNFIMTRILIGGEVSRKILRNILTEAIASVDTQGKSVSDLMDLAEASASSGLPFVFEGLAIDGDPWDLRDALKTREMAYNISSTRLYYFRKGMEDDAVVAVDAAGRPAIAIDDLRNALAAGTVEQLSSSVAAAAADNLPPLKLPSEDLERDLAVLELAEGATRIALRHMGTTGYEVPEDYEFHKRRDNPRVAKAWSLAIAMAEHFRGDCVETALANLGIES